MATNTYVPIETKILGSNTHSVTFSNIPQTYTDLILVFNGSITVYNYIQVQVGNGSIDTGANYSGTIVGGNGSSAFSYNYTNNNYAQTLGWAIGFLNNNNGILHFQNYSNKIGRAHV